MRRNVSESIAVMLETHDVSLMELVEARISLEVPLAGLAAQHATEATSDELLAAIAEAEGNDPASDAFRIADTRFHRVIATSARNELLRAFTSWTLDVLQPSLIDTIGASIDGDAILDQHRVIHRAIRLHQAGRRPARDAPPPRLPARARQRARPTLHDGRTVKAALMREYHQPLEFVERPKPEPSHPSDVRHPDRRRGRLRDRPARDRGADGARRRHAAARARPRERRLGGRGRRRCHDRRQGRRRARLPAAQLRHVRALPARRRHALHAPPVHRPDGRRRLRRLRGRAGALARWPCRQASSRLPLRPMPTPG